MAYLIGDPIMQDNDECEWPLFHEGILISFFPNIPKAARAGETLDAITDMTAGNTDKCAFCTGAGCINCDIARCYTCGDVLGDYGRCEDCDDAHDAEQLAATLARITKEIEEGAPF